MEEYKKWLLNNFRLNHAYPAEWRQENFRKICKITKAQSLKILRELRKEEKK